MIHPVTCAAPVNLLLRRLSVIDLFPYSFRYMFYQDEI